jgi:Tol biopolymer transport system component
MELYIRFASFEITKNFLSCSNKYGVIQQRLTFNDVFDGEAVVSPDGKMVIFSSYTGSDYELFQMNIDGTGRKQVSFCKFNLFYI